MPRRNGRNPGSVRSVSFTATAKCALAIRATTLKYNSRRMADVSFVPLHRRNNNAEESTRSSPADSAHFRNGRPACAVLSLLPRRTPPSRHYPAGNEIAHGSRYFGRFIRSASRLGEASGFTRYRPGIFRCARIIGKHAGNKAR